MHARLMRALLAALLLGACATGADAPVPVGAVPIPTQICDTRFRLLNSSGRPVTQIFINQTAAGNWGVERLGTNTLPPNGFLNLRSSEPGAHDFRLVWQDGAASELRNVDVCALTILTLTDTGLVPR